MLKPKGMTRFDRMYPENYPGLPAVHHGSFQAWVDRNATQLFTNPIGGRVLMITENQAYEYLIVPKSHHTVERV
jgi:hypothetical protein